MAQKEPKHVAYSLCINTNTIIINIIVVLTGSKLCFTINRSRKIIFDYIYALCSAGGLMIFVRFRGSQVPSTCHYDTNSTGKKVGTKFI